MFDHQPIAYFNSNQSGIDYLCFGDGLKIQFDIDVNFDELSIFLKKNKGKFIYGFFAYDVKNSIEQLESNNHDGLDFPVAFLHVPETVVQIERGEIIFIQGSETIENQKFVHFFLNEIKESKILNFPIFQSRISKNEYINKVNELKKYIQRGDIYEINFCQEYYAENVDIDNPVQYYSVINKSTHAPFSVYLKQNDFHVFCGSPERFLKKTGNTIVSQPIKGTAKRGETIEKDQQLKNELKTNPKEMSENVMIVDLVRNDLSKFAAKGSVNVDELFGVHSFKTVHQMISTISCQIDDDCDFSTILKATFPMGSMTGAPKINAMKLSEKIESFKRGLYSGTIGYFLPNGDFDFNVVIRTLLYNQQKKYLSCGVGGAITIQSDAEKEYEECQTKVSKILSINVE